MALIVFIRGCRLVACIGWQRLLEGSPSMNVDGGYQWLRWMHVEESPYWMHIVDGGSEVTVDFEVDGGGSWIDVDGGGSMDECRRGVANSSDGVDWLLSKA